MPTKPTTQVTDQPWALDEQQDEEVSRPDDLINLFDPSASFALAYFGRITLASFLFVKWNHFVLLLAGI